MSQYKAILSDIIHNEFKEPSSEEILNYRLSESILNCVGPQNMLCVNACASLIFILRSKGIVVTNMTYQDLDKTEQRKFNAYYFHNLTATHFFNCVETFLSGLGSNEHAIVATCVKDGESSDNRKTWFNRFMSIGYFKHPSYFNVIDFNSIKFENDKNLLCFQKFSSEFKGRENLIFTNHSYYERQMAITTLIANRIFKKNNVLLIDSVSGTDLLLRRLTLANKILTNFECERSKNIDNCLNSSEQACYEDGHNSKISKFDFVYFPQLDSVHKLNQTILNNLNPAGRLGIVLNHELASVTPMSAVNSLSDEYVLDEVWVYDMTSYYPLEVDFEKIQTSYSKLDGKMMLLLFVKIPLLLNANSSQEEKSRGYLNYWVEKSLITSGVRLNNAINLERHAKAVLENAERDTIEFAAALCVYSYRVLERHRYTDIPLSELTYIQEEIEYIINRRNLDMRYLRWKISLSYVGALLYLHSDNLAKANARINECIAINPNDVVPMIATKTISALILRGMLSLCFEDVDNAIADFKVGLLVTKQTVGQGWEVVIGDINEPVEYGLAEISEICSLGHICASAINTLNNSLVDGYFWRRIGNTLSEERKRIEIAYKELFVWAKNLQDWNNKLSFAK